jgi:hypothetical protein
MAENTVQHIVLTLPQELWISGAEEDVQREPSAVAVCGCGSEYEDPAMWETAGQQRSSA